MQPRRYTKRRQKRNRKAKVLVVMGALVVVVSGIYAIDASRTAGAKKAVDTNTASSRNAARSEALESIARGIDRYIQVNKQLPAVLPQSPTEICVASSTACKTTNLYDASYLVTSDTGLLALPTDPIGGPGQYGSGYFIARGEGGKMVLSAPRAEDGKAITVTR